MTQATDDELILAACRYGAMTVDQIADAVDRTWEEVLEDLIRLNHAGKVNRAERLARAPVWSSRKSLLDIPKPLVSVKKGVTFYAGVFEDSQTGERWQSPWTLNRFRVDEEARNMAARHIPRLILRCQMKSGMERLPA